MQLLISVCIFLPPPKKKNDAGPQQLPSLIAPPTSVTRDSVLGPAPAPAPQSAGSGTTTPKSTVVPTTGTILGLPPLGGPIGGASGACSLVNPLATYLITLVLYQFTNFMSSLSL